MALSLVAWLIDSFDFTGDRVTGLIDTGAGVDSVVLLGCTR